MRIHSSRFFLLAVVALGAEWLVVMFVEKQIVLLVLLVLDSGAACGFTLPGTTLMWKERKGN